MDEDPVDTIAGMLERGQEDAAFAELRTRFGWPVGRDLAPSELPRWIGLVAALAARRNAPQLTALATEAVRDPDSPDRLYDLGYALIDAGAPAIAASILWRCLALVGQSEEVVCELVSALESALAYDDAFGVLAEYPTLRQHSFLCRYLYAFDAVMSGRLDVARETAPQLLPDTPEHEGMAATIHAMLARVDRLAGIAPLDRLDLRGWHYVIGGSVLLHQSPYGYDEPMHGRYAWLGDSYSRIAFGLSRLAELARAHQLECVYAPPGRDHEIVAIAASRRLDLPLVPWPAVGVPAPGLVVLYNLADLAHNDVLRLLQRRPDQILFAHATPWTVDNPVSPDVTTLLFQTIVPPWGESMIVNRTTEEIEKVPADERPAEELAEVILAAPPLDSAELVTDQPERYAALVKHGWPLDHGPRNRLWAGGPVPSSRFA